MKTKLAYLSILLCGFGFLGADQVKFREEFRVSAPPRLLIYADPCRLCVRVGGDSLLTLDVEVPDEDICSVQTQKEGSRITLRVQPEGTRGNLMQRLRLYEADIRVSLPRGSEVVLVTRSGRIEVRGVEDEVRFHSGPGISKVIRWIMRMGS